MTELMHRLHRLQWNLDKLKQQAVLRPSAHQGMRQPGLMNGPHIFFSADYVTFCVHYVALEDIDKHKSCILGADGIFKISCKLLMIVTQDIPTVASRWRNDYDKYTSSGQDDYEMCEIWG